MDKVDQQSGGEPKNPMTKEDAARILMENNRAAKLLKTASLHASRPLQTSMKTRAKKEELNSLVENPRIP